MSRVLSNPKNGVFLKNQLSLEFEKIGLNSISIVVIISFFVGGY